MNNKKALYILLPAVGVGLIILLIALASDKPPVASSTAIKTEPGEKVIGTVDMNGLGMSERAPPREAPEWKPIPDGKGVKAWIIQEGQEEETVKATDRVTVKYIGWRARDGEFFDGNSTKDESFTTSFDRVIKGWPIGMIGMKVGEIRRILIPSELGYGDRGGGDKIPPHADLIFEVKLLRIIR